MFSGSTELLDAFENFINQKYTKSFIRSKEKSKHIITLNGNRKVQEFMDWIYTEENIKLISHYKLVSYQELVKYNKEKTELLLSGKSGSNRYPPSKYPLKS